jgi:hypothetical protein
MPLVLVAAAWGKDNRCVGSREAVVCVLGLARVGVSV